MLRILMPWTDHSESKPISSRRYFVAAILRALLLCGPAVTVACAGGRPLPDEPVVIVASEVKPAPEPGTWIVSDAWMVRRLQTEQDLEAALAACRNSLRH